MSKEETELVSEFTCNELVAYLDKTHKVNPIILKFILSYELRGNEFLDESFCEETEEDMTKSGVSRISLRRLRDLHKRLRGGDDDVVENQNNNNNNTRGGGAGENQQPQPLLRAAPVVDAAVSPNVMQKQNINNNNNNSNIAKSYNNNNNYHNDNNNNFVARSNNVISNSPNQHISNNNSNDHLLLQQQLEQQRQQQQREQEQQRASSLAAAEQQARLEAERLLRVQVQELQQEKASSSPSLSIPLPASQRKNNNNNNNTNETNNSSKKKTFKERQQEWREQQEEEKRLAGGGSSKVEQQQEGEDEQETSFSTNSSSSTTPQKSLSKNAQRKIDYEEKKRQEREERYQQEFQRQREDQERQSQLAAARRQEEIRLNKIRAEEAKKAQEEEEDRLRFQREMQEEIRKKKKMEQQERLEKQRAEQELARKEAREREETERALRLQEQKEREAKERERLRLEAEERKKIEDGCFRDFRLLQFLLVGGPLDDNSKLQPEQAKKLCNEAFLPEGITSFWKLTSEELSKSNNNNNNNNNNHKFSSQDVKEILNRQKLLKKENWNLLPPLPDSVTEFLTTGRSCFDNLDFISNVDSFNQVKEALSQIRPSTAPTCAHYFMILTGLRSLQERVETALKKENHHHHQKKKSQHHQQLTVAESNATTTTTSSKLDWSICAPSIIDSTSFFQQMRAPLLWIEVVRNQVMTSKEGRRALALPHVGKFIAEELKSWCAVAYTSQDPAADLNPFPQFLNITGDIIHAQIEKEKEQEEKKQKQLQKQQQQQDYEEEEEDYEEEEEEQYSAAASLSEFVSDSLLAVLCQFAHSPSASTLVEVRKSLIGVYEKLVVQQHNNQVVHSRVLKKRKEFLSAVSELETFFKKDKKTQTRLQQIALTLDPIPCLLRLEEHERRVITSTQDESRSKLHKEKLEQEPSSSSSSSSAATAAASGGKSAASLRAAERIKLKNEQKREQQLNTLRQWTQNFYSETGRGPTRSEIIGQSPANIRQIFEDLCARSQDDGAALYMSDKLASKHDAKEAARRQEREEQRQRMHEMMESGMYYDQGGGDEDEDDEGGCPDHMCPNCLLRRFLMFEAMKSGRIGFH